jgi:hypothetical protein
MQRWRVASPLCAPSRATILSGRYLHNIANAHSVTPASAAQFANASGGRGHLDLGEQVYPYVFAKQLRDERGYHTALFGKCMNGGCGVGDDTRGRSLRNMGAFSRWFESVRAEEGVVVLPPAPPASAAGAGTRRLRFAQSAEETEEEEDDDEDDEAVPSESTQRRLQSADLIASFFDSDLPSCVWVAGVGYTGNCLQTTDATSVGAGYSTSEIGNATASWVHALAHTASTSGVRVPWMAFVAVEAPKLRPAPWHWSGSSALEGPCVNALAPRLPNWNYTVRAQGTPPSCDAQPPTVHSTPITSGFHELIACQPPLLVREADYVRATAFEPSGTPALAPYSRAREPL